MKVKVKVPKEVVEAARNAITGQDVERVARLFAVSLGEAVLGKVYQKKAKTWRERIPHLRVVGEEDRK